MDRFYYTVQAILVVAFLLAVAGGIHSCRKFGQAQSRIEAKQK